MEAETESYLLLLLSDSNLPTGSFVSSSGLESYFKHGFPPSSQVNFISDSLHNYAHLSLPFIYDVYHTLSQFRNGDITKAKAISLIGRLDSLYESMTLNHITRRASKAQGVALLTLYSKGFSPPASLFPSPPTSSLDELVDEVKFSIRKGLIPGHLPICWAILTTTLQLSLERSQHLHLFLHARAILSASVRLNTLGPYAAQQLLLHVVRGLVDDQMKRCKKLRTSLFSNSEDGPATTWPLGEILAARHDLQHSRIFNS